MNEKGSDSPYTTYWSFTKNLRIYLPTFLEYRCSYINLPVEKIYGTILGPVSHRDCKGHSHYLSVLCRGLKYASRFLWVLFVTFSCFDVSLTFSWASDYFRFGVHEDRRRGLIWRIWSDSRFSGVLDWSSSYWSWEVYYDYRSIYVYLYLYVHVYIKQIFQVSCTLVISLNIISTGLGFVSSGSGSFPLLKSFSISRCTCPFF